jgi:protein-S-isoprenylcysteine O-methyltransferase Ste14
MKKTKIQPPNYFLACLLLIVFVFFVFPIFNLIGYPYTLFGLIFVIIGIILNLWTDSLFKKTKTTVKPDEKPTTFLTSGPFHFSRHPMYLGMVFILLGVSIVLGSVIGFIFPILFVFLMQKLFIPVEEKNMEAAFGQKYLNYKKKIRCWL